MYNKNIKNWTVIFKKNNKAINYEKIHLLKPILIHILIREIPSKTIVTSISIIILLNLILGLSRYLMMNYGSGIIAESEQLPIIILLNFNFAFKIIWLFNISELVNILLISFIPSIFLYCLSWQSSITK